MINAIYLDSSTAARPSRALVDVMSPFFLQRWGMTTSPHQPSQELIPYIREALGNIYDLFGASEDDDFVFTSSGIEAVNHLVSSVYYDGIHVTSKNHFLFGATDEVSGFDAARRLEEFGCVATIVPASDSGMITPEAVQESITPRTALLSLSWANGLTGVINPVNDIAAICRERGVLFHLDATHILGKLDFDLKDIGVDFVTFNGSQLHGPVGTGGLLIRYGRPLRPLILGGDEQGRLRAGDVNVPYLVGLGHAAKEAIEKRDFLGTEVARWRNALERSLLFEIPDAVTFFADQERLPHCSAIAFPGVASEAMLYALSRAGVFANFSGKMNANLRACGVKESLAQCAVSFSMSRDNSEDDVHRVVDVISDVVRRFRRTSEQLYEI